MTAIEYPINLLSESPVCYLCIRFRTLADRIRSEGSESLCSHCGERREVLSVDTLIHCRPELPVCYSCIEDDVLSDEVKLAGFCQFVYLLWRDAGGTRLGYSGRSPHGLSCLHK